MKKWIHNYLGFCIQRNNKTKDENKDTENDDSKIII